MARDVFINPDRCSYCGRPGFVAWDVDLFTCRRETCEALAYGELMRRARRHTAHTGKRLERALVTALTTFEHELRLDVDAELISHEEAKRIDRGEREATGRLIGELHDLTRGRRAA